MPRVTAFVPAYERPDTVVVAIRSALAQTYDELVVLVGDDSQSDRVEHAVRSIGDDRIRYHRNATPLGATANWLDLIERADTEFVASLNDDDWWDPSFLAATVPPMEDDPAIAIAFSDYWYVGADGERLESLTEQVSNTSHRDSIPAGTLSLPDDDMLRIIAVWNAAQSAYAAVMRRDAVLAIPFSPTVDPCHDLWCTYQLWRNGHRFHYTPQRLTSYRLHPGNLTNAGFATAEDHIFDRIVADNPASSAVPELNRRWARIRFHRAMSTMVDEGRPHRRSRGEMAAAVDHLDGWRRVAARACAKSSAACRAVGVARRIVKR